MRLKLKELAIVLTLYFVIATSEVVFHNGTTSADNAVIESAPMMFKDIPIQPVTSRVVLKTSNETKGSTPSPLI
jgi:hypothetical protein